MTKKIQRRALMTGAAAMAAYEAMPDFGADAQTIGTLSGQIACAPNGQIALNPVQPQPIYGPEVTQYTNNAQTGVQFGAAFTKNVMQRTTAYCLDELGNTNYTWPGVFTALNNTLTAWQYTGQIMSLTIPMVPSNSANNSQQSPTATLKMGAAGQFTNGSYVPNGSRGTFSLNSGTNYFGQMAYVLIAFGFSNAKLRLGHEFNGNWFGWHASQNPVAWVTLWQNIVNAMRAVPGANFAFVWNPTLGVVGGGLSTQSAMEACYPGDPFVDEIAIDWYDTNLQTPGNLVSTPTTSTVFGTWPSPATGSQLWWFANQTCGLNWWIAFANTHNKGISITEVAAGKNEDGYHTDWPAGFAAKATFPGYISGTTLTLTGSITTTVTNPVTGQPIMPGFVLSGTGVTSGTTVVSGSGSTWVVTPSQTAGSAGSQITITTQSPQGDNPYFVTALYAIVTSNPNFDLLGWWNGTAALGFFGQISSIPPTFPLVQAQFTNLFSAPTPNADATAPPSPITGLSVTSPTAHAIKVTFTPPSTPPVCDQILFTIIDPAGGQHTGQFLLGGTTVATYSGPFVPVSGTVCAAVLQTANEFGLGTAVSGTVTIT